MAVDLATTTNWREAMLYADSLPTYKERSLAWARCAQNPEMSTTAAATLALTYAQLHLAEIMEAGHGADH